MKTQIFRSKLLTNIFSSNILLSILFLVSSGSNLYAQPNTSYVFRKDFIYKANVYRLEVEKEPQQFNFYLTYSENKSLKDTFDLVSVSGLKVFQLKLQKSLSQMYSQSSDDLDTKEEAFEAILSVVLDSVESNPNYILTDKLNKNISSLIRDLSYLNSCDSIYAHEKIDSIKILSSSLNSFFTTQETMCNSYRDKYLQDNLEQINQLASSLLEEIKTAIRINPVDASLAGRLRLKESVWAYAGYENPSLPYDISSIYNYDNKRIMNSPEFKSQRDKEKLRRGFNNDDDDEEHEDKDDIYYSIRKENNETSDNADKVPDTASSTTKIEKDSLGNDIKDNDDPSPGIQDENIDSLNIIVDVSNTASTATTKNNIKEGSGDNDNDDYKLIFKFDLDSVQLEFENGTLNNVKAIGKIGNTVEIFQNLYPIPYSTKNSLSKQLKNYFLTSSIETEILKLRYPDLFYNDYELLLRTENYSPKDQIVMLYPNKTSYIYKESNKEILSAKVYTDFIGLGRDEPNGIIQLEFSKIVNLYTGLRPYSKYKGSTYFTFLNFIKPMFTLSKIEDDDSELNINSFPSLPDSINVVSYEDLLKYRRSSIGMDLNIFGVGMPGIQSKFSVNFDLTYHLISFKDEVSTIDTTTNIVTITENNFTNLARDFGPSLEWTINPSDKYSFMFKYAHKWFRFYPSEDNIIIPINSRDEVDNSEQLNSISPTRIERYHYLEFLATSNISDAGDLFFRTRFSFLKNNPKQQFFQIQLGYSFFFFTRNK